MDRIINATSTKIFLISLVLLVGAGLAVLGKQKSPGPESVPDNAEQISGEVYQNCIQGSKGKRFSKEECYSDEFAKVAEVRGAEFAFETLFALQKKDTDAVGCHLISHGIGSGAYKNNPDNWQTLVRSMNSSCTYGAIHGVIENYIATLPQARLTIELLPTICGDNPRADCNHIIGHLTLVETKADIGAALEMCEVFKEDRTQLFHCQTGVYMEYQTALNLIDHGLAPESWLNWPSRVDELEKVCREAVSAAVACWKEIVHAALVKFHNDPKTIFDFCSSAQVVEGSKECRRHAIGIMAAAKRFDLEPLKPMCSLPQKSDPSFESDCYVQLVASMLSTLPSEKERAKVFCESLAVEFRTGCLNQIQYQHASPND